MSFDLGTMMDSIQGYQDTLKKHSFQHTGSGTKPWSNRHSKDNLHVDVRYTEWTMYCGEEEIASGRNHSELNDYIRDYTYYTEYATFNNLITSGDIHA